MILSRQSNGKELEMSERGRSAAEHDFQAERLLKAGRKAVRGSTQMVCRRMVVVVFDLH